MDYEANLKGALVDVRKSYRLLWSYQRRVFDIIGLIASEMGQDFYYWQVLHSDGPVRSGTNPLKKWAWDMLPMVQASYLFLPSGADPNSPRRGEWMLEISVLSDSGFDEPKGGAEPDASDFPDAAECASTMSLFAWYCKEDCDVNWFNMVWNRMEWPKSDEEVIESDSPPIRVVRKNFNLEMLGNKDAVRDAALKLKGLLPKDAQTEL